MKLVPIDFEFHDTSEPCLNVVCGSLQVDGVTPKTIGRITMLKQNSN
jgi:hypothetical protein